MIDDTGLGRFARDLGNELASARVHALRQAQEALETLPAKAKRLDVGIHLDQDCEGRISLLLHVDGPDLHALNDAIGDYRLLFEGYIATGVEPGCPFELKENVAKQTNDLCAEWAKELWRELPPELRSLPAMVVFMEDALADPNAQWIGGTEAGVLETSE